MRPAIALLQALKKPVLQLQSILKKPVLHPHMTAALQIVGTGRGDLSPSVYLFTDSDRYLFNCGEGTQRFFMQQGIRWGKLATMFITRMHWDCLGGIPGALLTIADYVSQRVTLYGPPQMKQFIQATQKIAYYRLMCEVNDVRDFETAGVKKENLTIYPILIMGPSSGTQGPRSPPLVLTPLPFSPPPPPRPRSPSASRDGADSPQSRKRSPSPSPPPADADASAHKQPRLDPPDCVVVYHCEVHQVLGKMNMDRATALGVPKSRLLADLKDGKSVTLPCGKVVHPHEVLDPIAPVPSVLLVDCPTADYLPAIAEHPKIAAFYRDAPSEKFTVVVHMGPAEVVTSPAYLAWRERFGPSAHHIMLHAAAEQSTPLLSFAKLQTALNTIHPHVFPLPHKCEPAPPLSDASDRIVPGTLLLKLQLLPIKNLGYDATGLTAVDTAAVKEKLNAIPGLAAAMAGTAALTAEFEKSPPGPESDLLFLGTGSSLPSKYRNVSAILLRVMGKNGQEGILLDCGEGTYGQLWRHYGSAVDDLLRNLKCVFISHMHADHHLGLIRILLQRQALGVTEPLVVIGPFHFDTWHGTRKASVDRVLEEMGFNEVTTVVVKHCKHAFGIVLGHAEGWRLVYSGDTRPCKALIEAGKGADILIHEATFENGLMEDALSKLHSTTTEAIEVGKAMGAKSTILTHFSQRYPRVPVFDDAFTSSTSVAFDHMCVFANIYPKPEAEDEEDEDADLAAAKPCPHEGHGHQHGTKAHAD